MKVWIVTDYDYDNWWVVAVYSSEALANEHVSLMDGSIKEMESLTVLHPDARDPIKQKERADEAEMERRQYEHYQARLKLSAELAAAQRPSPPYMKLCCCETFTSRTNSSLIPWTEHGYCRYCGGWSPNVFRKHMGESSLQEEISKLGLYKRDLMQQIVGQSPDI